MRTLILSLATAAAGLAIAAPASAQFYPQQPGYAYGAPYGNAYGYHNNYGQVRRLDARIDALQRQIRHLDRRNVISEREADRLRNQSRDLERRLHFAARNGLHPAEAIEIERRIARLEYRLFRDARDGRGWSQNGWSNWDRDRDGRDDRYEDDRGRDHDGRRHRDDDDD